MDTYRVVLARNLQVGDVVLDRDQNPHRLTDISEQKNGTTIITTRDDGLRERLRPDQTVRVATTD